MWRSAEWTASNERRGSPNGYGWKVGIEGRRKRAACERTFNHGVQVCVASSRGNAVAEIHFQLGFRPHVSKCSCIDARPDWDRRRDGERNAEAWKQAGVNGLELLP